MKNPLDYMFPQEWEFDFQPLSEEKMDNEEIKRHNCEECNKTLPEWDALATKKHTDGEDIEMHFCGESCANEFYLRKLRESGV